MPLDTNSFDLHRSLPLAPDRLWSLLTDPKHREKWGVPGPDMVLTVEQSDLRVGGQDRHRCGPADDPMFFVETRWYDLVAPERAVFTETLLFEGAAVGTSLVTYALAQNGETTDLAITVAVSSFSGAEALGEFKDGWEGGLANLEAYAATQTGS